MTLTAFSSEQLDAAVKKVIPDLPAGHSNAIVLAVDNEGAKAAISMHIDSLGGIEAKGYGAHYWDGNNVVGAEILHSW